MRTQSTKQGNGSNPTHDTSHRVHDIHELHEASHAMMPTQAGILGLQRSLGNQYVQRMMVQRATAGNITLTGKSVGKGGENKPADVTAVQARLKELGYLLDSQVTSETPNASLAKVPDASLTNTIMAIKAFQRQSDLSSMDGRIDAGGGTLTKLNANQDPIANTEHRIAGSITGIFEGGKPDSINTYDNGIISYGKHQATLASGSLYSILKLYTDKSTTTTATTMKTYLSRVQSKDATLKNDSAFIQLLKDAATDPMMSVAQEEAFKTGYWDPAMTRAGGVGITTPLGKALLYDTEIQHGGGGNASILSKTKTKMGGNVGDVVSGKKIEELAFLKEFLAQRKQRLLDNAKSNRDKAAEERAAGNEAKAKQQEANANALENAANVSRVPAWQALLDSGDLQLTGGADGFLEVRGVPIVGLRDGATTSATTAPTTTTTAPTTTAPTTTAPTTTAPTTTTSGPITYTVKSGDTLGKIAAKHNTTVDAIAKANGIADVNRISLGQKLIIPGTTAAPSTTAPAPATTTTAPTTSNTNTNSSNGGGTSWVESAQEALVEGFNNVANTVSSYWNSWFGGGSSSSNATAPSNGNGGGQPAQTPTASELTQLMAKERLSTEEIARARTLIGALPDEKQRGDMYQALQGKVQYHSQRDNTSTGTASDYANNSSWLSQGAAIGDIMCNLTSLAMIFEYLGITKDAVIQKINPTSTEEKAKFGTMQLEDLLETLRVKKGFGARTTVEGWGGVAAELGITYEPVLSSAKQDKAWWLANVATRVRQGQGLMMSIGGHIVRLQDVTEAGLTVDDPYGAAELQPDDIAYARVIDGKTVYDKDYTYKYDADGDGKNDDMRNTTANPTRGEDNVWNWTIISKYTVHWVYAFKK